MSQFEFLINVNDLRDSLSDRNLRVVDCRFDLMNPGQGHADYLDGHIAGAVYADLDRDLAAPVTEITGRHPLPDPQGLAEFLGRLGINSETQVVVYDDASGAIAARLWWLLKWLGHSRVAVLNGGYKAWLRSATASVEMPQPATARYVARSNEDMVVSTGDLLKAMAGNEEITLVDARDRARFAGEVEPIDSAAGHIPGAINFPFVESLNADGTWLAADTLTEKWSSVLGPDSDVGWIAMCGSGVTACHLAISAELAGYAAPALYVGSWSEWIRDPARRLATGSG